MLEAELATICPADERTPQVYRGNQEQDLHKLRLLLERECAAQVGLLLPSSHLSSVTFYIHMFFTP